MTWMEKHSRVLNCTAPPYTFPVPLHSQVDSVGASAALMGLVGARIAGLMITWTRYESGFRVGVEVGCAVHGLLPHIHVLSHKGALYVEAGLAGGGGQSRCATECSITRDGSGRSSQCRECYICPVWGAVGSAGSVTYALYGGQ